MKIFDCTTFYAEHLMMDVRFNVLNDYVEKFIVCESTMSHSGERKKLNFDIKNYPKFAHKIKYVVIDKEPDGIIGNKDGLAKPYEKRSDSLKRINLSYDYMINAISDVSDNDLIVLSDNDEIPNLNSNQFKMVEKFFETMPKLSHTVKVTNPNTKVESEIKIEGLQSFFA